MARKDKHVYGGVTFGAIVADEARPFRSSPVVETQPSMQDKLSFEYARLLKRFAEQERERVVQDAARAEEFLKNNTDLMWMTPTYSPGRYSSSTYPSKNMGSAIHETMSHHFAQTGELKPVFVIDAEHGSYTVEPDDLPLIGVDLDSYRIIPRMGKSVMAVLNGDYAPLCQNVSVAGRRKNYPVFLDELSGWNRYGVRAELSDWADHHRGLNLVPYFTPRSRILQYALHGIVSESLSGFSSVSEYGLKQAKVMALSMTDHGAAYYGHQHILGRPHHLDTRVRPHDASGSMNRSSLDSAARQIAGLDQYITHDDTVRVVDWEPKPFTSGVKGHDDTHVYVAGDTFNDDMLHGDYHLEIDKED